MAIIPPLPAVLRRLFGTRSAAPPLHRAPPPVADEQAEVDRALATALEQAVEEGQWERAARLAETAMRIDPKSYRLIERLARLRQAVGEPERAVRMIDALCRHRPLPTSLGILRAACLVRCGRKRRALHDLRRWSKRATMPLAARLMLALLEWDGGDAHGATLALVRNVRAEEDPRAVELLLILAVAQTRAESAWVWCERLAEAITFGAHEPYTLLMLRSLGLEPTARVRPRPEHVDRLARELAASEEVIPALVEAQRLRPQPEVRDLLERGIERALPALCEPALGIAALARLALLRGDHATALRWTEQGLSLRGTEELVSLHRALRDEEDRAAVAAGPRPAVLAAIGAGAPGAVLTVEERGKKAA